LTPGKPCAVKAACTVWWGGWWKRAVRHRALSLPNADRWDSGRFASHQLKRRSLAVPLVWSIETHGGHLLGNVALHRGFRADAAELGLFIGEKGEWSKGYGTDAVRTILGHAFGPMGFWRIYLHTDVENQRAHRCFARCGFRQEGLVKEYRRRWGEGHFVDGLLMAILAREFTGEVTA
jgi:RimJ/RimL family protein N-acetyltransferase